MLDDLSRQTERRIQALETFSAVEEVHRMSVEKRLASIEDTLKWLVRLIIGSLLMALVAYVLNGGFGVV